MRRKLLAWIAKFRPEASNNAVQTAGFGNTAPAVGAGVQQSKRTVIVLRQAANLKGAIKQCQVIAFGNRLCYKILKACYWVVKPVRLF
jgi:hypothetical protein